jgi:hypothetical protein
MPEEAVHLNVVSNPVSARAKFRRMKICPAIAEFSAVRPVKLRSSRALSPANPCFTGARSLLRYDFERIVEAALKAGVAPELYAKTEEFSYGRT